MRNHPSFSCATCTHGQGPKYKHTALSWLLQEQPRLVLPKLQLLAAQTRPGWDVPSPLLPPLSFYGVCRFMNKALTVPKPQRSTSEGELKLAGSLFPELSGGRTAHVGCWRSGRQNSVPKKTQGLVLHPLLGAEGVCTHPTSPLIQKTRLLLESPVDLSCASTSQQLLGAEEEARCNM